MEIKLKRFEGNPILSPTDNWWETKSVFNPGAIKKDNKIILLYRAIGNDGISRFGYAETSDGFHITRRDKEPILEPPVDDQYERLGIEDPRITKLLGKYYIAYTCASVYAAKHISPLRAKLKAHSNDAPWRVRAALLKSDDLVTFKRLCRIIGDVDDKDIVLFPEKIDGKYMLLDRIYPNITIASSTDLKNWSERKVVMTPRNEWEAERVGAGTVPIKTKKGWLIFYHAASHDHIYRLGFAYLDLTDPTKVLYRHPEPIFEPEENYEKVGRVANVVFTCGAVLHNGKYFIYYGAADQVIGVATIDREKIDNIRF
jgi:predicted GH43/DUF377 family glycosyl hydrolase